MVLRRPGTIHRTISMNKPRSALDARKTKKFKLRQKLKILKKRGPQALIKTPRIDPEDEGIIPSVMVKNITRHNPLANIKLSKKKRNKLLKRKRPLSDDDKNYDEKAREDAAKKAEEEEQDEELWEDVQMEEKKDVKKTQVKKSKRIQRKPKGEQMDCD